MGLAVTDIVRVLIVEDEFLIAEELVHYIRSAGFDCVGPVGTLADALAIIEAETFHAAILDGHLHAQSINPVAERIAALGIPFALATGQQVEVDGVIFRDRPSVRKPYSEAEVLAVLAQLITTASDAPSAK